MSKKAYTCTRRVECDHQVYEEGASIELDDQLAEALLACGAIVEADGSEPPKSAKKKK